MGYFKRPIRRKAARKSRLAHFDATREIAAADWRVCDLPERPEADMFLRFAIDHPTDGRIGLFRAADVLEDDPDFPPDARRELERVFAWFAANLAAPRRLPPNAVCWFRADAKQLLEAIRTFVELYRMHDRPVWMLVTRHPGRIVYRDEHQVAAVPQRDRRVRSSVV